MDDKPEDWQKEERIKAEIDKAIKDSANLKESKTNLAYLDTKFFAVGKGFSTKPEAFLVGGEKMANIGIILAVLGMLGDKILEFFKQSVVANAGSTQNMAGNEAILRAIGYLQSSFQFLIMLAPFLAIAAIASAAWYYYKTKKKVSHILISAGITIGIFLLNQGLTLLIAKLLHS